MLKNRNSIPQYYTLHNGIYLVHFQVKTTAVSYLAAAVAVGSRHENQQQQGLSHFTEHLLFKGTTSRNYLTIANFLERRGGDLNAYTTKEETVYHAVTLKKETQRAFEILSDIIFNPLFNEEEMDKERSVILDEINVYKDSPSELIFDEFDKYLFAGSSLGHTILGDAQTIKKIKRTQIQAFHQQHYKPQNIVLCSLSALPVEKMSLWAEQYFGHLVQENIVIDRNFILPQYLPFHKEINKNTHQLHCLMGGRGYSFLHPKRHVQSLLLNMLGGQQQNSLLNLQLREKEGLVYQVEASGTYFVDSGSVVIYFGTDKKNKDKGITSVQNILHQIKEGKITSRLLYNAKKQFIGQLIIGMENDEQVLLSNVKNVLTSQPIESIDQLKSQIESITLDEIRQTACELFDNLSLLVYS